MHNSQSTRQLFSALVAISLIVGCSSASSTPLQPPEQVASDGAPVLDASASVAPTEAAPPDALGVNQGENVAGDEWFIGAPSCAATASADASAVCTGTPVATPASLVVENGCAQRVDLWLVTLSITCPTCCADVFSDTIEAGHSLTRSSFVSQVWRLRLPDGGPTVLDIPPLQAGTTRVHLP
jgi:hypothetical protein